MSEANASRGFPWGKLVLFAAVVIILRVNLPPASVSGALDLSELENEGWFTRVTGGTAIKIIVSDSVAGWRYRDFIVFRVATSEKLNATAIGLPFCKWRVYDNGQ